MEPTHPLSGVYVTLDDLVYMKYQARGFDFLSSQPVQSLLSGRHASRLRGRGLDFEELRHYLPGDDIRTIDWKATRRSGKAQVRVFAEEKERPCLLVVDQRLSMFFGTKKEMKSVTAAKLAALSAWRVVQSLDRAGAIVFNDSKLTHVKPQRSKKTVMHILKTLCDFNGELGADKGIAADKTMLDRALDTALRSAGHDYVISVISDFSGAGDNTHRLIRNLARHNDVMLFFVYDPIARTSPEKGRLVISDGESQVMVDMDKKAIREKGSKILQTRFQYLLDQLSGFTVPVLPITTDQDTSEQIRMLLGKKKIEL